jgi:predicted MFS family arabinose efflux permease
LILGLTVSMAVVGIFGMGMLTLLPAWAVDVLGGDVQTNGWLVSMRGLGSLIAALMLASMGRLQIRGKLWTIGSILMPVMLFVFAWVRSLPLSLGVLMLVGWSFIMMANNSNAMIQSLVSDELRGRVMSIYTLAFFTSMPLGSVIAGFVAERIGAPLAMAAASVVLLLMAAMVYLLMPRIRAEA